MRRFVRLARRRSVVWLSAITLLSGCAGAAPTASPPPTPSPTPAVSEAYAYCEPMVADTLDALDAVEMTLNSETVTFEEARFAVAAADAVLQSHGFPTEITPYTNDCSAVILEAQKSVIGYKTVMGIWSESCPTLVQQDCPTTPFVRITLGIADARNAAGNARHDLELLR